MAKTPNQRGRPPKGKEAMTAAERQRRKREAACVHAERVQRAHNHVCEANAVLWALWNRLNGNKKYRQVHDEIGKAARATTQSRSLLEPVRHLPISQDRPRKLICGSSDVGNVTNNFAFQMILEEQRCPECARRRREFYP